MPNPEPPVLSALSRAYLAAPEEGVEAWLGAWGDELGIAALEELKAYSDARLLSDPRAAERATRRALRLAEALAEAPLAPALAAWARGNWASYHAPDEAARLYEAALAGYRSAGAALPVARLLSNLVGALAECGRFGEAQAAYAEAHAILAGLGAEADLFLMRLCQNYGWLLHTQGRYEEALAAHGRALDLAHGLGLPAVAAEVQVNRTLTLGMLGRMAEGEAALLREGAVAAAHGQLVTVARIDMDLADLYVALGRPAEALRRFQGARAAFEALGNPGEAASVLRYEAGLLERIGALREARAGYARAQAQFAADGRLPDIAETLLRQAAICRIEGDFARAAGLLDEVDARLRALGLGRWRVELRLERAALALEEADPEGAMALLRRPLAGELPAQAARRHLALARARAELWREGAGARRGDARRSYGRALAYAEQVGDLWLRREALAGLGLLALPDDPRAARASLEAAAALDEMLRQALSVEELKASYHGQAGDLLPRLATLSVAEGRPAQALGEVWRAKGGPLLDLLQATGGAGDAAADAAIAQVRQQLASRRWALAREADATQPAALQEARDPQIRALEGRLLELRRQRNAAQGGLARLDLARLLPTLDADVLIEYVPVGTGLLAIRADREGRCRAAELGEAAAILDLLDTLQLSFQHVLAQPAERQAAYGPRWLAECRPLLARGYAALIAPLGPLPRGARLLIAPCEPLYLLPFAALWDGVGFLAEGHVITMTPTGALLAAPPPAPAAGPPLVIGASFEGQLAAVAAEVAAVAAALPGARTLLDDPGALAALAALPAPPRVLHLAAHSTIRDDAPLFSALQLPGGALSVEQCFDLSVAGSELVTLSACATGAGLESGGALLAFQTALFVAGARHVLSSLWPVADEATAALMARLYAALAAGEAPPAALRAAQLALMAEPALAHPALWAAFACARR